MLSIYMFNLLGFCMCVCCLVVVVVVVVLWQLSKWRFARSEYAIFVSGC